MSSNETNSVNLSTRTRLLNTASQLFYEQGYNATTLAQISANSGINNGLITYYFGTKGRLASEIYNLFLMDLRAEITRQLFVLKKDYFMDLCVAMENRILLTLKFTNPNLLRFSTEYRRDQIPFEFQNERRERYYTLQKALINPEISDTDLELYSVCGVSVVHSITEAYNAGYLHADIEYLKDYVIRTLFTMLKLPQDKIEELVETSRILETQIHITMVPPFTVQGGTGPD